MLHQVYLSFGANLGDRQANIRQALQYIQTRASVKKISSFYETEPEGFLDQPMFLNSACVVETVFSPGDMLRFLKWIEKRMGRRASFRNAPRPIDIDILFYDDLLHDSPDLKLPHPRLNERAFVLVPLAEIAPDLVHPVLNLTVTEMLNRVDQAGVRRMDCSLRRRIDHDVQQPRPTRAGQLEPGGSHESEADHPDS